VTIAADKIVLYFELRAGRNIDQELRKVKGKVKRWNHTLVKEMGNIFKRATFFRFSTVAINSFFNSISYARTEAIKFQSALANIVKLDINRYNSLASDATKELGRQIGSLASQYNVARTEAAKAYETVVTAGFRGAEATKLFETALLAQASAGLSANNAISLLIATMKQFGIGVNDTEKALDTLLSIQSNAAIGFDEFAGAFRTGGAALASVTENLGQAGALIAALSERTRESGSVVGTFFKTLSARTLGRATTKKQLAQLGIAVEVEGKLRPMIDLLEDLNKALENMGDARKGEILSVVAGQRQINRLVNIMAEVERVRQLEATGISHMAEARRRAAIEQQTFAAKWNKLQIEFVQGLEESFIGGLDEFVVAARAAAGAISGLGDVLLGFVYRINPSAIADAQRLAEMEVQKRQVDIFKGKYAALPQDVQKRMNESFAKIAVDAARALQTPHGVGTFKTELERSERQLPAVEKQAKNPPTKRTFFGHTIIADREAHDKSLKKYMDLKDRIELLRDTVNAAAKDSITMDKDITKMKDIAAAADEVWKFMGEASKSDKKFAGTALKNSQAALGIMSTIFKDAETEMKKLFDTGKITKAQFDAFIKGTTLTSPGAGEAGGAERASMSEIFKGDLPGRTRLANDLAKVNEQLSQTYEQILNPAKSFNDALLSQRQKLQALLTIEGQLDEAGMKRVNEQLAEYNKIQDEKTRKTVLAVAQFEKEKIQQEVTFRQRQREAKLLEYDANALRRLNTRLHELKNKAGDASAQVATATNRLNEARKNEIRSMEQVASATASLKAAIGQYAVGLMMARVEAGKITGVVGGLAQELGSVENISKVIDGEMRLSTLRRDSLSAQLSIVQEIISKQQQIGMSYLTAGGEQKDDIFRGFGALQNVFGKFGGNASSFNQMSDQDMNEFGRMVLALPADVRKAMVDALGFLPEGGTVAGFTSDQLRNMLSSAALGRGGTVSNVQDMQKRAAEATVELARLNTDGLSVAIQQYQTSNQQLDQAKAQTELQKIRVAQAREQLDVTLRTNQEHRDSIEKQMSEFSRMAAILRESQTDQKTPSQKIQERARANQENVAADIAMLKEKKQYNPVISAYSGNGIMGPNYPHAGPPTPTKEQRSILTSTQEEELGKRLDNLNATFDKMIAKAEQMHEKKIEDMLVAQDLEKVGKQETKVLIEVANKLQIEYADVAELPYLIVETVRNLPQIKDFDSFKGAVRTIVSAIAASINTGQPLDPSIANLIGGMAVQ